MSPAVRRWKELTEVALPRRAAAEKWPLRYDHCFKRVTLDHVFQDVWYKHLAKPAAAHLSEEQAARAVLVAEAILQGGPEVLKGLNNSSLKWRGKREDASTKCPELRA